MALLSLLLVTWSVVISELSLFFISRMPCHTRFAGFVDLSKSYWNYKVWFVKEFDGGVFTSAGFYNRQWHCLGAVIWRAQRGHTGLRLLHWNYRCSALNCICVLEGTYRLAFLYARERVWFWYCPNYLEAIFCFLMCFVVVTLGISLCAIPCS